MKLTFTQLSEKKWEKKTSDGLTTFEMDQGRIKVILKSNPEDRTVEISASSTQKSPIKEICTNLKISSPNIIEPSAKKPDSMYHFEREYDFYFLPTDRDSLKQAIDGLIKNYKLPAPFAQDVMDFVNANLEEKPGKKLK